MWHKDKCARNNDKHLVKVPFEDIADKDGQDIVNMDKLCINTMYNWHIKLFLNSFLVRSSISVIVPF